MVSTLSFLLSLPWPCFLGRGFLCQAWGCSQKEARGGVSRFRVYLYMCIFVPIIIVPELCNRRNSDWLDTRSNRGSCMGGQNPLWWWWWWWWWILVKGEWENKEWKTYKNCVAVCRVDWFKAISCSPAITRPQKPFVSSVNHVNVFFVKNKSFVVCRKSRIENIAYCQNKAAALPVAHRKRFLFEYPSSIHFSCLRIRHASISGMASVYRILRG